MRALQYRAPGTAPEVVTVPDPEPVPGQVLLKVTAAGVCHSDIHVMSLPGDRLPCRLPLTLGHEGAGSVAALVHIETYTLDEAPKAYERLRAGKVDGRAVILPNS
jgi:D-arabinose 1-dehydrogenase-like Zn-dependent alcohol dehydrogenase